MKRILMFLPLIYVVNSYASQHPVFEDHTDKGEILVEADKTTLVIKRNNRLGIRVHTRNFSKQDIVKLYQATKILEKVMNSPQLKNLIENFEYKGEKQFHQNKDLTNLQIYSHIMTGSEDLKPNADQTMDFDLTMYRSWNPFSSVKGYTKPGTMRIWIHSKFYRRSSWSVIDVASNLAHEWLHKMGFGHDYYYNEDRPYSVPYAIGNIVAQVAQQM